MIIFFLVFASSWYVSLSHVYERFDNSNDLNSIMRKESMKPSKLQLCRPTATKSNTAAQQTNRQQHRLCDTYDAYATKVIIR